MNKDKIKEEIINDITRVFGNYVKNLTIDLEPLYINKEHLTKYSIRYESLIEQKEVGLEDAVEEGKEKHIVEIIWQSLCVEAQNTYGKSSDEYKDIESRGVRLGFVTEDQKNR